MDKENVAEFANIFVSRYPDFLKTGSFKPISLEELKINDDVNMFAAELWFRSLPEVPAEEAPKIEQIIHEALGRMRTRHEGQSPSVENT